MANSLIMSYVLKKFQNVKSPVNNRWFAYVNSNGILSTRGLANHMVDHGMTNKSDVLAMLSKLSECIPELVAQGYSVKLDGIGIFYPVIANAKGGADSVEDFSVTKNIAGVRFRFKPFGRKVSFGNGYYKESAGKRAPLIPLAAANQEP